MLPVECIARGYLAGLGLKEYEKHGTVSGVALPPGLVEGSRLPEPIFTPTTKAPVGEHDEFLTFADVEALVGAATAERLRDPHPGGLPARRRARRRAGASSSPTPSSSSAATPQGAIVLADEVLTPDSSRFWPADRWAPGGPQFSFDKQFVRDWSAGLDWDRTAPGPEIPPDVVAATRARYMEVYETLTGRSSRHGAIAVCSTYRSRAASSRRRSSPRSTPAACR